MKLREETSVERSATAVRAGSAGSSPLKDIASSPLVEEALKRLPEGCGRYVARAPGRLDVMGGSAAYSGSMTISLPLDCHVIAASAARADGQIEVTVLANSSDSTRISIDHRALSDGTWDSGEYMASDAAGSDLVGVSLAALHALRSVGIGSIEGALSNGLSVVVGVSDAALCGTGWRATCAAGVLASALTALTDSIDTDVLHQVIRHMPATAQAVPLNVADVLGAFFGRPGQLTQVPNDSTATVGSAPIPGGLRFVAIECGTTHPQFVTKYWSTRVAVDMGREILSRIIAHDFPEHGQWGGYLSRVSVADYVERFRDRIPTRITGKTFVERFGELNCAGQRIIPSHGYKVRSRTEHHIYEHSRAMQFAHQMTRSSRVEDSAALHELGELMYASHWSYGQRCGMGSIEADCLVSMLRGLGEDRGIIGAKITDHGCGGTIAVLMRDTPTAQAALEESLSAYEAKSKKSATLLESSIAGIFETGVVCL